jgi:hypothetical protein
MIRAIALVASAILAGSFRSANAQTGSTLGSYLVENGKIFYEECGTGGQALVHLMYIEKPEEFLTIVTHFLEGNRWTIHKISGRPWRSDLGFLVQRKVAAA